MSDFTFTADMELQKVLGLGVLDQLSKKLQNGIATAVRRGLFDGQTAGLDRIKQSFDSSTDPTERKALEKLYKAGIKARDQHIKEVNRIEKENQREAARIKRRALARAERAAEKDAANQAKVNAALPALGANVLGYADSVVGYGESFLTRQSLNVLTRETLRKHLPIEVVKEAAYKNFIARSANNYYAKALRSKFPWVRLAAEQAEEDRIADRRVYTSRLESENAYRNSKIQWISENALSDRDLKEVELYEAFSGQKVKNQSDLDAIKKGTFGMPKTESLLQRIASNTGITAGLLAGTAGKLISDIPTSYWHERSQRDYSEHKIAQAQRETTVGMLIGGILGGAVGGVLTAGNPAGIGAGAALGGSLGGLPGKYDEEDAKAKQKSIAEATQRVLNRTLYGAGGYSTSYAKLVATQGLASEQDVSRMAGNAATLRGRMMLGQVGEQEMYYYSMLPNYFAALLAGVTGPELAELYKSDLNSIADPSLRMVIGTAVGGGSTGMYAYSQSPLFDSVHGSAGLVRAADVTGDYIAEGVVSAAPRRGGFSLMKEMRGFGEISRDKDPFLYNIDYGKLDNKDLRWIKSALDVFDSNDQRGMKLPNGNFFIDDILRAFGQKTTTVIVNVDGVEKERIEFKEDFMNAGQTMIVGSI